MKFFLFLMMSALVWVAPVSAKPLATISTDDDPKIIAAQKKREDAVRVLSEAEAKHDKVAIEAAQTAKNAAMRELTVARAAAFKERKDKANESKKK